MGVVYYLWDHSAERQVHAKIDDFVQAIFHDDQSRARDLWEINNLDRRTGMAERRERIISDLISAGIQSDYEVLKVVWWSTCCEPRPISDSDNAGEARTTVQFTDKNKQSISFTFEIHTREPYWGDAKESPPREWVIRDIYPPDEEPLRW